MKRRPLLSLLLRCSLSWFGDRTKGPFAAVRESLGVQVFGCRRHETIHTLGQPASEKRQGTKSRGVGHRRCSGRYGDLA